MIVACLPTFRFLRKTSKSTGRGLYSNTYNTYNNSAWADTRRTMHSSSVPLDTYHSGRGLHTTAVYGGNVSSSVESLAPKNGVLVTTSHQVSIRLIIGTFPHFQSLTLKPSLRSIPNDSISASDGNFPFKPHFYFGYYCIINLQIRCQPSVVGCICHRLQHKIPTS